MTAPSVHVRWMIRRDMTEVLDAERGTPDPWTEAAILAHLRRRATYGYAAELGPRVVGHMLYSRRLTPRRTRYLELERLAVHPDFRGRGVGRALMLKLLGKTGPDRFACVVTRVRETDDPAHRWLARQGFEATGVDRGHYDDTGEDAYVFRRPFLVEEPAPAARGDSCDYGRGDPRD